MTSVILISVCYRNYNSKKLKLETIGWTKFRGLTNLYEASTHVQFGVKNIQKHSQLQDSTLMVLFDTQSRIAVQKILE